MSVTKIISDSYEELIVVVEIPAGSYVKYEYNKNYGVIEVDRILNVSMPYPFNYGFVPNTIAGDGDPVDVLIISQHPFHPGSVIKVRPIGVLFMKDENGNDEKIIVVPTKKVDPYYSDINDISDLTDLQKNKIKHFFERYKDLEVGKFVQVESWGDSFRAKELVRAYLQVPS